MPDVTNPKNFSRPSLALVEAEDLRNPDYRWSDAIVKDEEFQNDTYGFAFLAPRPNRQSKPLYPKPGERDIWSTCSLYQRKDQVVHPDLTSTFDLKGVTLVLWSDGKIERVPTGEMIWYPQDGGYVQSFRGQTGLPKQVATEAEQIESGVKIFGG
ncbi:hypothetical protein EON81_09300 [bacterium]|nr:MAG: hypothetical protein EON81_09300 [bacterium]